MGSLPTFPSDCAWITQNWRLTIGHDTGHGWGSTQFEIDEFALYMRVLTDQEINQNYNKEEER